MPSPRNAARIQAAEDWAMHARDASAYLHQPVEHHHAVARKRMAELVEKVYTTDLQAAQYDTARAMVAAWRGPDVDPDAHPRALRAGVAVALVEMAEREKSAEQMAHYVGMAEALLVLWPTAQHAARAREMLLRVVAMGGGAA